MAKDKKNDIWDKRFEYFTYQGNTDKPKNSAYDSFKKTEPQKEDKKK